mgnify:CR=1 FL=1
MKYSVMRGLGELNSIERRLPLYYRKLNELEKRKSELRALIAETERREQPVQPKKLVQSSSSPALGGLFDLQWAKGFVQRYWMWGAPVVLALIVLAVRAAAAGSSRG